MLIKDIDLFLTNSIEMIKGMAKNLENIQSIKFNTLDKQKTLHIIIDMNNGFAKKGALYSDRVENIILKIHELQFY